MVLVSREQVFSENVEPKKAKENNGLLKNPDIKDRYIPTFISSFPIIFFLN